jgi:hypothetical protein
MKYEEVKTAMLQEKDWHVGQGRAGGPQWLTLDPIESNGRRPAVPTPRRGDPANKRFSWQK